VAEDESQSPVARANVALQKIALELRDASVVAVATGGDLEVATGGVVAMAAVRGVWDYIRASHTLDVEECCTRLAREIVTRLDSAESGHERAAIMDTYLLDSERARILRKGFQEMLDVTTSSAWPCIAALVADYWAEGRPLDAFFKEATSLFAECVFEDLQAIEILLHRGQQFWSEAKGRIELNFNPLPTSNITITHPDFLKAEPLKVKNDPRRAIRILGAHSFGTAEPRGERLDIRADSADDCWRLLRYVGLREHTDGGR
jgi:hypothetical protein